MSKRTSYSPLGCGSALLLTLILGGLIALLIAKNPFKEADTRYQNLYLGIEGSCAWLYRDSIPDDTVVSLKMGEGYSITDGKITHVDAAGNPEVVATAGEVVTATTNSFSLSSRFGTGCHGARPEILMTIEAHN